MNTTTTIEAQARQQALRSLTSQAEGVWQAVVADLPAFTVEVLPSVDSTNSELMRRARSGDAGPQLLLALEQTAGRGRRGKAWISQPGASLTFSLGLPFSPTDWSGLSLAVGVSLAESLHPDVRLKWPNDLWWNGRKLGGILVETASLGEQRYLVVGVGLNMRTPVLPPASDLPQVEGECALPAVPPVGLDEVQGAPAADAGVALAAVLPALVRDVLRFEREGFGAFMDRFGRRDALLGLPVSVSDGRQGTAAGVAPGGELRLTTLDGVQTVTSAEVSVRPC